MALVCDEQRMTTWEKGSSAVKENGRARLSGGGTQYATTLLAVLVHPK